jgi:hypothetical protein
MSEQKIEAPTESDIDGIARAVVHAERVVEETLGSKLDGTRNDLSPIHRLLDQCSIRSVMPRNSRTSSGSSIFRTTPQQKNRAANQ